MSSYELWGVLLKEREKDENVAWEFFLVGVFEYKVSCVMLQNSCVLYGKNEATKAQNTKEKEVNEGGKCSRRRGQHPNAQRRVGWDKSEKSNNWNGCINHKKLPTPQEQANRPIELHQFIPHGLIWIPKRGGTTHQSTLLEQHLWMEGSYIWTDGTWICLNLDRHGTGKRSHKPHN